MCDKLWIVANARNFGSWMKLISKYTKKKTLTRGLFYKEEGLWSECRLVSCSSSRSGKFFSFTVKFLGTNAWIRLGFPGLGFPLRAINLNDEILRNWSQKRYSEKTKIVLYLSTFSKVYLQPECKSYWLKLQIVLFVHSWSSRVF